MSSDIKLEEDSVIVEGVLKTGDAELGQILAGGVKIVGDAELGQIVTRNNQLKIKGWDLILDAPERRTNLSEWRRALVHDYGDKLTLNWGNDYPGGVKIVGDAELGQIVTRNNQLKIKGWDLILDAPERQEGTVVVPNLVTLGRPTAEAQLDALQLRHIARFPFDAAGDGRATQQSPQAGTVVKKYSVVTVSYPTPLGPMDDSPVEGPTPTCTRRALVHDYGDKLTLNWGNNYPGGVKIEGDVELGQIKARGNQLKIKGGIKIEGKVEVMENIISEGSNCAEEFTVVGNENIDPGTVMVIDEESRLRPSKKPFDKKVVGVVVSGDSGYRPGIILEKMSTHTKRMPIALTGKVYCKVDASYSPIEVGDLLTTSSTPGHAMKADDPLKAFGAVIGKALFFLRGGTGLIPILAALQ